MPWLKYISVALASTIKFFGGPLAGAALGLTWAETAICSLVGMMTSVLASVFLGQVFQQLMAKHRTKKPKLFSKRTRWAVKIWQRFGLHGIALLTPPLFTPIGGTLLAVSLKVPRAKILLFMLFYGVLWALVVTLAAYEIKRRTGL